MEQIEELIKEYQKTDKHLSFKTWLLLYKEEVIKHNEINYIMKGGK